MSRLRHALACRSGKGTSRASPRNPSSTPGAVTGSGTAQSGKQSGGASVVSASPEPLTIAVDENHLVNASGSIVALHGVDISGTMWSCLYGKAFATPNNEASIAAMAAWHINAVRIPLNEDCWLGINGAPIDTDAYHEEIRAYVDRLHTQGIYAILDLHWSAPGGVPSHPGAGYGPEYEMADEDHTPAFWESLASYFVTDHAVLFDLYNEPFNISWTCWRVGCIAPAGYETAGMQQLINVVRGTGATQPVMVGGIKKASVAGPEWLANRPVDSAGQLVASVHEYNEVGINNFNANIGTVAARFPVVMGEIGEKDCTDNDLNVFLPWADAHGISYLAWGWIASSCTAGPALISNYAGTPTEYGIGYREHLQRAFPAPSPPS